MWNKKWNILSDIYIYIYCSRRGLVGSVLAY